MTGRAFQTPPTLFSSQPVVFPSTTSVPKSDDRYCRRDNSKVKVQAWRLDADNASHLVWQTDGYIVDERDPFTLELHVGLNMPSLGGVVRASEGDWVVKLGERTFRKMNAVEFQRTYKPDA